MVDFRKAFLLLAVLVMMTGAANAQAISCVATSGQPPLLRAEGVAEEVGQVTIECTGGIPTAVDAPIPPINIQVFLNVNVTSRLLVSSTSAVSEALLLIDDPAPSNVFVCSGGTICSVTGLGTGGSNGYGGGVAASRPNAFQGLVTSNSVIWGGVPFDPPGTSGSRKLRLVNVRANASQLGVSSTLIPSAVNMFIAITGTGSLQLTNPQLTVGFVQKGMSFSATTASYNQCEPRTVESTPYTIKFKELFNTAFRANPVGSENQSTIGTIYNTESMYSNQATFTSSTNYSGSVTANGAGVATQGTRLIARFSNVPANVAITVQTSKTVTSPGGIDEVALIPGATNSTTSSSGVVSLTGGAGAAVWEVTTSNANWASEIPLDVWVTYSASALPGLGTATVTGNYAPTTTIFSASYTAPVPRFVDDPQSATTFTINSCKTNLLFPFLTNQAGFDSGVVISNTSLDPFSTVPQRGPCTLYYYGNTNGTGAAPNSQISGTVNEGTQLVATLSGGGNLGIAATPGFQGYMIASCNFQYAHGFAFISDLGSSRVAEGYLALIMDQNMFSGKTRTGATSEQLNQ